VVALLTLVLPVILVNIPLPGQLLQLTAKLALIMAVPLVMEALSSHALPVMPTTTWITKLVLLVPMDIGLLPFQLYPLLVRPVRPVAVSALQLLLVHARSANPLLSWTQQPALALNVMILNVLLVLLKLQGNAHFAKILRATP